MINDVYELAREHLQGARDDDNGRSSHLFLHEGPLRQSVIALTARSKLGTHHTPGSASVFVVSGRVRLIAEDGDQDLAHGQISPIPHERHSVEALEDSVVILTSVTEVG